MSVCLYAGYNWSSGINRIATKYHSLILKNKKQNLNRPQFSCNKDDNGTSINVFVVILNQTLREKQRLKDCIWT